MEQNSIRFTYHAIDRVRNRLNAVVSLDDIKHCINSKADKIPACGRCWVCVKKMKYTEIKDSSIIPDGIARGDMVIMLVEDGCIRTVCLRKSWSKSGTDFQKIIM